MNLKLEDFEYRLDEEVEINGNEADLRKIILHIIGEDHE